ncbi:MAG: glycosyltransferase family 39 protein [Candidatus Lernaella stagnicola]|nr:glycosyltransferase family 39 protein [Candidatus Lernaella stagnicola]
MPPAGDQGPRYGRHVLIAALGCMAVVLAVNLWVHDVPWGLEHDGLFLVDTDHADWEARQRPVGYVLLLRAAALLFGSAFRAGHVLAALFTAGFVWSAYRLSWRLFRREDAALFSAAALLVFPRFLFSALLANHDAAFAFCGAMALAELFPDADPARPPRPVRLGLWLAAAYLVKVLGLFLFIGALALLLFERRWRPRRALLWRVLAAFVLPILLVKLLGTLGSDGGGGGLLLAGFHSAFNLVTILLQLPPEWVDQAGPGLVLVTIVFRAAAAALEWLAELPILFTPLLPVAALVVAFDRRQPERAVRVRRMLVLLAIFVLCLVFTAWRGDEQARYFLPFAPLLLGALFVAVTDAVTDPGPRPRLRRALGALVLVLALTGLAWKAAPPFARDWRYYDWQSQGDRRLLTRAESAAAVDRLHAEFGEGTLFATNNPAFGLEDPHLIHYDWYFEDRSIPSNDQSQKGQGFYRADLTTFLCRVPATAFLYDSTDRIIRLHRTDDPSREAAQSWLLQPAAKVGPVVLYRVNRGACDKALTPPGKPVEPQGPPPSSVAPPLSPLDQSAPAPN